MVGYKPNSMSKKELLEKGFDAITYGRLGLHVPNSKAKEFLLKVRNRLLSYCKRRPPHVYDYKKEYHGFINKDIDKEIDVIPQLYPQWDHSPRTGSKGNIYINSEPKYFKEHVKEALDAIKEKPEEYQILILKSWNEWAEGNYMEPDLKYGKGYMRALHSAISEFIQKI